MVYRSERVITLAMMDEVHQRPAGTARRNFNQHRGKLLEDVEFFDLPRNEWGDLFSTTQNVVEMRGRDSRILLTESGYLLLVKSFRDPLAWEVQRALVQPLRRPVPASVLP